MRIVLDRSVVVAPDYAPHAGRVLIDTETAAIVSRPRPAYRRQILQLARERIGLAVTTLKLDGPSVLLAKARHMSVRERLGSEEQYICFAGTIAGSSSAVQFEPHAAVAGFSLTHPRAVQSYMQVVEVPANSWYYWPSQGSRVIGNACHIMDLALALSDDSDPLEIETCCTAAGRPDENVSISVSYADGSTAGLLYTKRGQDGLRERHVARRGDRTGEIEDFKRLRMSGRHGRAVQTTAQDFGHRRQVQLFLDAVRGNRAAPIDLRTLLISSYSPIAADQSLRTGKPVTLPIKDIDRALARPS